MALAVEVASFTDAWIETDGRIYSKDWKEVASFTDAWIETDRLKVIRNLRARRIFYRCVD